MSDLNTTATVDLQINGQQAQSTLIQLKQNALNLEYAIAKAAAAGNKTDLKRLRRELAETKKQIREVESSTQQVEDVLRHLDKASPRELNKSLQTLNRQLEYIERGSKAWEVHTEKIRIIKEELARINSEIRLQESAWERFNRKLNDWQTAIMGMIAAVTGLIMAGRSAVKAYAEMDEQLADTRKYTSMATEDVNELNESFKQMDTRTSREQLNELAQEAGRLGKTTKEDVQGYVEAADIINVALVDLGAGATQTIAKLTNIFRVDEELGTKDAMLSVGSAVNVLSQNCTASKQYLVEFTQRMAGVGAQAELTIPQLLAYGATLDANGQKTEMSASALGKLTMMLYQKPGEVAQQVGLDVQKFTETLKQGTNEGIIMFLERIRELGSKDGLAVLAPLFKDLGMDGVRMSQVLATLAEHLDMVKWEQEEANKAFREASSASHEYEIFNNTVQAGLDKAKKHLSELSIELGEKLLPVMSHVMTSSSMMMRALNIMVDFVIENWTEIRTATVVIAAYTVSVNANTIAMRASAIATTAWNAVMGVATTITKGFTKAMVLSKDAIVGCSLAHQRLYRHMLAQNVITKAITASALLLRAAYYACTLQISAMTTTLKSLYVVMSANPYALIITALAAVGAAVYNNIQKKKEQLKLMEEERLKQKELMKDYDDAKARITMLSKIINDNTRELKDRKSALDELKKIVPDYHADLTAEGTLINNNTDALDKYLAKLKESILMRANREKLEELYKQQSELQDEEKEKSKDYWDTRQTNTLQGYDRNSVTARIARALGVEDENDKKKALEATQAKLREVNAKIADLEKKVVPEPDAPDWNNNSGGGGNSVTTTTSESSSTNVSKNKFEEETEWKKREEALTRISYARGESDFITYTDRMQEIEVEYNKKKLQHTDLTENERISIQAEYYEALKKQQDTLQSRTIEEENAFYNEEMAALKQRFVDGKTEYKVYEEASEQLEMQHLKRLSSLYVEGSKEQISTQKQLQDKLVANQRKHQQETEAAEKKHQDAIAKMKAQYFGDNPQERAAKYASDIAMLYDVYRQELSAAEGCADEKLRIEEAFQKAKLDLMRKYNIEGAEENKNFLQTWNDDIMEFLDSDVGGAIKGSLDVLVSSMSSIFQQLTTIVQAELEIQTASINKRYDAEIKAAEGNNYQIKKIEKKREAEIAKAKNEANKKMYAMQVAQAIASTALSAINAYSSAAQVPYVGYILAPVAAGLALAAGALQISAIKKQQQASEAKGYASGGFTPDGHVDEEVGVVHAGEWVASQRLVRDPRTRPLINALDYAQRNNSYGNISAEDVGRTISAPTILAHRADNAAPIVVNSSSDALVMEQLSATSKALSGYSATMKKLQERLDEPFITVNTVTGEFGSKQAQDEYDLLIRNKTPKSRR